MKNPFLVFILLFFGLGAFAQNDSTISLRIIGEKVYVDKTKLLLSFSYFYRNNTAYNQVLVDYYDPCFWENQVRKYDSTQSQFLYLVIKDDSGKMVLPTFKSDSSLIVDIVARKADSLKFVAKYEKEKISQHNFHTRVLKPEEELINLFTMRLNKRKCFEAFTFDFDFSRKYYFKLIYLAEEDVENLANHTGYEREDKLFVGQIQSNEVELGFK